MSQHVAIIGAGWAGLAAAVRAVELGLQVSIFEAARHWGGRARRLSLELPAGGALHLDNGQHILIGAYRDTLGLMRKVGVPMAQSLRALPLDLRFADGGGLAVPAWAQRWPAPLNILAALTVAAGWSWADRGAFLAAAARWRWLGFRCAPEVSVADLCRALTPRVMEDLIEPLCLAALNTPARQASAQVFLTVLQDSLLGAGAPPWRASDLLLPRTDLGQLMPDAAIKWLQEHGAQIHGGSRVRRITHAQGLWQLHTQQGSYEAEHVILATAAPHAASLLAQLPGVPAAWLEQALALQHEPIATVYVQGRLEHGWPGRHPMLALRSREPQEPAQFVFLRNELDAADWPQHLRATPLLAFVASACRLDRAALEAAVLAQARRQLHLAQPHIVQTVLEQRATFVCSPGLKRPSQDIVPGLSAAGDYVQGPYPATLEGAVRSGLQAAERACAS